MPQSSRPLPRRQLLRLGAAAAALGPALWSRHAPAQGTTQGTSAAPLFGLGIASGTPRPDTVVLWTRLIGEALPERVEVQWELAHDEAFTRPVARGSQSTGPDEAHSVHAEPQGLEPQRAYWYRFTALGQRSPAGLTRTAPRPGDEVARLAFHIASCQRFEHGHYAAWRDVAENPGELVLFLGDYIYEYGMRARPPASWPRRVSGERTETLSAYRQRYAEYKADPLLQAAHAAAPWIYTWDDHEVENDYAGLQGERLQPNFAQQRAAAYQAWWEHQPVPRAMKPVGPDARIYGSLDWGRLARLHVLDARQYRDVQVCPRPGRGGSNVVSLASCPQLLQPERSLLGAAQERWLAGNWSLDHPWNLLAQQTLMARLSRSPTQVEGQAAGHYWTDGWDGYPAARTRLLQAVAERKLPGLVVLGGDVHANFAADLRLDFDDAASPVLASEFCGTSISSEGGGQAWLDAALPHNPHLHHGRADQRGTMRFVLERQRLEVELRVVEDVRLASSAVRAGERFAVEARRPGVQRG